MNREDFDRLTYMYMNDIYKAALVYCRNIHDAEDVTQTAFQKLFSTTCDWESDQHVKRWLLRVVSNESRSLWRSFGRKYSVPLDSIEGTADEPSSTMSENSELFYAILDLPDKYRRVVHLYYYEDYSVREISEILGISETSVQTRLARARQKLKNMLKEDL